MRIALNAAKFYAVWFIAVIAAARGSPWAGVAACAASLLVHLAVTKRYQLELLLVAASVLAGLAVEGTLLAAGLVHYVMPGPFPSIAPMWLIAIWVAFGTTLNVSLAWMQQRLRLAAVCGLIAAPLSYWAGARLGAMTIVEPQWIGLLAIGILWALVFPALLVLARRLSIS